MAFLLNEEVVEGLVQQVNDANPAYQFDWRTYAYTMKQNGRSFISYLFLENDTHFALITPGGFDVSKVSDVHFLEKSEVQGLKIRKGLMNTILKIRMYNGEYHKLIFNPKAGKKLPLHRENVVHYREKLAREYAHQTDLKDRNSSIGNKIWTVLAWIFAFIAMIIVIAMTDSKFLAIAAFVAVGFGFSWLAGRFEISSAKRKDKAFFKEVEGLTAQYAQGDPSTYFEALKTITHHPQTPIYQAQYYQMLIALAYDLDRLEEAKHFLALFPRRYSEGTEELYQGLVNLLATPKETIETEETAHEALETSSETEGDGTFK